MQLSRNAIKDFKKIYLEEFKVRLTNDEANKKGAELLGLVRLIHKPVQKLYEYANSRRNYQK